jgi:hypothetical protein
VTPPTKFRGKNLKTRVLPEQCIVRKRVEKAMRSAPGQDRADPHRWLGGLKMLTTFAGEPLEVRFREISPSHRALMETLGVTVIIDPKAPEPYVFPDVSKRPQSDFR